ncbi:MAG: hypothetical protein WCS17_03520, partial [Prevotella sp.]
MDHIALTVNATTHVLSISTESPLTQIDQEYCDITVTLPEGFENYFVRLTFEIPIKDSTGHIYYPYIFMEKNTENVLIPYPIPSSILQMCKESLPVRVYLGIDDIGFSTVNTIKLPVASVIPIRINNQIPQTFIDYNKAFISATLNEETKIVTLTAINGTVFNFPVIASALSDLTEDADHQTVTEDEKSQW